MTTNDDRADWAQAAVNTFRHETGTDQYDAVADLVADLCHLAARWGQDPIEQISRGLRMYADERDFPPDGWAPENKLADVTIYITRG